MPPALARTSDGSPSSCSHLPACTSDLRPQWRHPDPPASSDPAVCIPHWPPHLPGVMITQFLGTSVPDLTGFHPVCWTAALSAPRTPHHEPWTGSAPGAWWALVRCGVKEVCVQLLLRCQVLTVTAGLSSWVLAEGSTALLTSSRPRLFPARPVGGPRSLW